MSTKHRPVAIKCSRCQKVFADAEAYIAHRPNLLISCFKQEMTADTWEVAKEMTRLLRLITRLSKDEEKRERSAAIESQMDATL